MKILQVFNFLIPQDDIFPGLNQLIKKIRNSMNNIPWAQLEFEKNLGMKKQGFSRSPIQDSVSMKKCHQG